MLRRITGFHQDEQNDWVADLECGHTQHVRHNPPWQVRAWVVTEEGRAKFLGQTLNCNKCDEVENPRQDERDSGMIPNGVPG